MWAPVHMWKRQRDGTIVVDLARHQPVALLHDREADTLATWWHAHLGIRIIARDRLSCPPGLDHPQLSFVTRAFLVKGELHIAVTGGQAVGVVVAAKEHNRSDLIWVSRYSDIEVPLDGDLLRRVKDDRSARQTVVRLKQVSRPVDLPVGNP